MTLELWIAFTLAAAIVLIIPGPTIIFVMGQAVSCGPRAVFPLVIGVTLGDFTAMTLSLLGLGAVLAASATLFTLLKWCGAIYLVYLGVKQLRNRPGSRSHHVSRKRFPSFTLFRKAYIITALNPKSIVFFVAFMPQFISHTEKIAPQLILMGMTFLCLAATNATIYGLLAGQLRVALHNPKATRAFDILGGSALIGAGAITTLVNRSS